MGNTFFFVAYKVGLCMCVFGGEGGVRRRRTNITIAIEGLMQYFAFSVQSTYIVLSMFTADRKSVV